MAELRGEMGETFGTHCHGDGKDRRKRHQYRHDCQDRCKKQRFNQRITTQQCNDQYQCDEPDRAEKSLEPISKSSEEDNEAGELHKAEEVLSVVLPADEDATLPLYPGEEALDEPAPHVTA